MRATLAVTACRPMNMADTVPALMGRSRNYLPLWHVTIYSTFHSGMQPSPCLIAR